MNIGQIHGVRALVSSAFALFVLAGCQQASNEGEKATGATLDTLPVSINAAMVSVVDHSADYIFALGNGDMPGNDHDWDQVRSAAYEEILAGKIIQVPGDGPNDAKWVADPGWRAMADDLTAVGQDALKLADAKSTDSTAWRALADRLVQNCLACHEAFKPEIPSEGILHEGTARELKGESIFD